MQLYPTLENRKPVGAQVYDVLTGDGVHVRAISVVPEKAKFGTIVLMGGRAEFIERYFETIGDFTKRGFAVVSFDWRGQGGSQRLLASRLRGHVESFTQYDLDLDAVMMQVVAKNCPKPYFGMAHSTGGQILLRAVRDKSWFKRAVISAPLLGFHFGRWPEWLVRFLNFAANASRLNWVYLPGYQEGPMRRADFKGNILTSDKARWDRDVATLAAHPELAIAGPTFGWLRAAMQSLDQLYRWPKNQGPTCPTMIVMAGQDRVVNNLGIRHFVDRVPGISLLAIPSSRHEILNENNAIREKFLAAFDSFMGFDN